MSILYYVMSILYYVMSILYYVMSILYYLMFILHYVMYLLCFVRWNARTSIVMSAFHLVMSSLHFVMSFFHYDVVTNCKSNNVCCTGSEKRERQNFEDVGPRRHIVRLGTSRAYANLGITSPSSVRLSVRLSCLSRFSRHTSLFSNNFNTTEAIDMKVHL